MSIIYIFVNRKFTQTLADSIIALADLAKAKLHALRANSFSAYFKAGRTFKNTLALQSIF
jgi:hypothetical protein